MNKHTYPRVWIAGRFFLTGCLAWGASIMVIETAPPESALVLSLSFAFFVILGWLSISIWQRKNLMRALTRFEIADEYAAHKADEHAAYAATLVEFSKTRQFAMFGALTMTGTKSNLYRRVEMLLNNKFQVAGLSRNRVVLGFATLMAVTGLLLASVQERNQRCRH